MKKYQNKEISEILCNQCGKKIDVNNGIVREGVYLSEMKWGYFSKKDGEEHSFELCEECYDNIVATFKIPIDRKVSLELL